MLSYVLPVRKPARGALLLAVCVSTACVQERPDASVDSAAIDSAHAPLDGVSRPMEEEPDRWDAAERAIPHLPLSAFPDLPDWAARVFADRGCEVPQAFHLDEPHNVVSGELAGPGQVDWAALCSRGDSAEIVVAWGGPLSCPAVLAPAAKRHQLQHLGGDDIGYSRALDVASMDMIKRLAQEFGGPVPPSEDHQGLEDIFLEKASAIHYCHNGKWVELAGVD